MEEWGGERRVESEEEVEVGVKEGSSEVLLEEVKQRNLVMFSRLWTSDAVSLVGINLENSNPPKKVGGIWRFILCILGYLCIYLHHCKPFRHDKNNVTRQNRKDTQTQHFLKFQLAVKYPSVKQRALFIFILGPHFCLHFYGFQWKEGERERGWRAATDHGLELNPSHCYKDSGFVHELQVLPGKLWDASLFKKNTNICTSTWVKQEYFCHPVSENCQSQQSFSKAYTIYKHWWSHNKVLFSSFDLSIYE